LTLKLFGFLSGSQLHYRTALNYSDVHLDDARSSLKRRTPLSNWCQRLLDAIDWANPFASDSKAAMTLTPKQWLRCLIWHLK
jgi:hypothetical protein